ncbi:MAG TPA: PKD domain-containing protein [Edaphocola sp.]|nr:PKD domain-containing protein [Edaphocola sp.]
MKKLLFFLTAFTVYTSHAATLYWVGGSGNWNDATKWSNSSGGSTCNCVPTNADDVVFNANSFTGGGQTVTINAQAYCKNMTWTSGLPSPTLVGSYQLDIYGSLTLSSTMNLTYTGSIYFKSNSGNSTITTTGKTLSTIYFDGTGGAWALQDALTCNGSIYLNSGFLNTNGVNVQAYRLNATGSGVKSLSLGNSTVTLSYGGSDAWWVSSSNTTFSAGTSTIVLTGANATMDCSSLTFNNVTFQNTSSTSARFYSANNSSFNNIIFAGGGSNIGGGTYSVNNLTLATSKSYSFSGTANLSGTLTANGTCAVPTTITGGTLNKTTGSVTIDYVQLTNVVAQGGATFTANNVTDFGGNTGWTLNTPTPKTLYWIGNSGNWTDPAKWSATSGGSTANCIPTQYDNVVFDANSFTGGGQTVTVNAQAYCKNMTWTSGLPSPTLVGSYQLDIYGSLTLSSTMNLTYTGSIYFKSNSGNSTITTTGKTLSTIYFDGTGGAWALQDALTCNGSIYLNSGFLNTNGVNVQAYRLNATGSGVKSLSLGNSTVTLSYGGSDAWWVSSSNTTFSAGTSTIVLTGANATMDCSSLTFNNVTFQNTSSTSARFYSANNSSFNNIIFAGGGSNIGGGTYSVNNLTLATSKSYSFSGTANLSGTLTANGVSGGLTAISGGTISKTSGTVCVNYVNLTNSTATGGASFYAANSQNTSGNSGWVFAACSQTGNPPVANFSATNVIGNAPLVTTFADLSTNNPTSWSWNFSGGTPSTSTQQNPTVTYNTAGTYDVSLTATNAYGSDIETKVGYITITNQSSTPQVVVTSPNGGETWTVGSQQNITATITGNITGKMIEYSFDGGNTWNFIWGISTADPTLNFTWIVPNTVSQQCRIRVSALYSGGTVSDISNANFTISAPNNGIGFGLNQTLSHLYWPYLSSTWNTNPSHPDRDGWKDGDEGGGGSQQGQGGHKGGEWHAQDWNQNSHISSNYDCQKSFLAPISGKVIYAFGTCNPECFANCSLGGGQCCGNGFGNSVTIQSDQDSNFAFRVSHLYDVFVSNNQQVNVGDVIGTVGMTGNGTGSHAHCALYKNVYIYPTIAISGVNYSVIQRLKAGASLTFTGNANNWAANFKFDAVIGGSGGGIEENPAIVSTQTVLCSGSSANLTAVQGNRYFWNTGDTTQTVTIYEAGTYSVLVNDGSGNLIATQTITVNEVGSSNVSISASKNSICSDESLQLHASILVPDTISDYFDDDFNLYSWSTGATTSGITISQPGTYKLTFTDGNGCFSNVDSIVITQSPQPAQPTIQVSGGLLAASTVSGSTYQWYLNNVPVATGQIINADTIGSGFYTVEAINSYGCRTLSDPYAVTTGIYELSQLDMFNVYPNPNTGTFVVAVKSSFAAQYEISCLNMLGEVFYSSHFESKNGELETEVKLPDVANGIYLLRITSDRKSFYKRIVIAH